MKLYVSPGSCSLSPLIALREAGLPYEAEAVSLATKKTKAGDDYREVNAKGSVPALRLDNGEILTEGSAIVQYIADQKPESHLAPPSGTWERYRLQEWLNYIATELHKAFGPFFKGDDTAKEAARTLLAIKFDFLSKKLDGKSYLMGETFTVADGYLYTILRWTHFARIDMDRWPTLKAYMDRIAARPAVSEAVEVEASLR